MDKYFFSWKYFAQLQKVVYTYLLMEMISSWAEIRRQHNPT